MTVTIDLPPGVADALAQKAAQEGRDVAGYVQELAVRDAGGGTAGPDTPDARTPGLHAGLYWIAEDFDALLPDDFWLGADNQCGSRAQGVDAPGWYRLTLVTR